MEKSIDYAAQSRAGAAPSLLNRYTPAFFLASDLVTLSLALPTAAALGGAVQGLDELRTILAMALVAWAALQGHYTRRLALGGEAGQLLNGVLLLGFADAVATHHFTREWDFLWLAARWLPLLVSLLVARQMMRWALSAAGLWQLPTLVVGDERVRAALEAAGAQGYRVVATAEPDEDVATVLARCTESDIQVGVLELEAARSETGKRLTKALRAQGVAVALAPSLAEMPVLGLKAQSFFSHDVVLLTGGAGWASGWMQAGKRVLDVAVAGAALLALSPVLALVALAVKADGGPLLFGHQRVGQGGRMFPCWKFRSMVPNAQEVLKEVLANDPEAAREWAETLKLKNDPRITRFGRFLRSSSLDELPQLFNVLKGDMSLIGPRPVTKAELDRYGEEKDYYLAVRPGISGLWQVSGRNDTSYGQRVVLDSWYVRNWSLWHDLAILAKTIPAVLRRSGAY